MKQHVQKSPAPVETPETSHDSRRDQTAACHSQPSQFFSGLPTAVADYSPYRTSLRIVLCLYYLDLHFRHETTSERYTAPCLKSYRIRFNRSRLRCLHVYTAVIGSPVSIRSMDSWAIIYPISHHQWRFDLWENKNLGLVRYVGSCVRRRHRSCGTVARIVRYCNNGTTVFPLLPTTPELSQAIVMEQRNRNLWWQFPPLGSVDCSQRRIPNCMEAYITCLQVDSVDSIRITSKTPW